MFKTEGYIEKFAKLLTDQMEMGNYTKEQVCIAIEEVLKDFQKDLLESASEGFEEYCIDRFILGKNDHERIYDAHTGNFLNTLHIKRLWQACALSKMKELQEKDEEIKRLKSLIKQERKE